MSGGSGALMLTCGEDLRLRLLKEKMRQPVSFSLILVVQSTRWSLVVGAGYPLFGGLGKSSGRERLS